MSVETKIDTDLATAIPEGQERLLEDRLNAGIAPKMRPVHEDIHAEILTLVHEQSEYADPRTHAELVAQYCIDQSDRIAQLNSAEKEFQTRLAHAVDSAEERAAILDFARALGADRKQLQSDRKAFDAWFDADAVVERFHKRVGERERALAHAIERLGVIAADAVAADPMMLHTAFFVELFDELLDEMRGWRGDARIRCAAHTCLATIAKRVEQWPFGAWLEAVLSATRRVSLDESEDVWVQCAAFDALFALSPKSIANAIGARLKQPLSAKKPQVADNELFLRRHIVRLLCANFTVQDTFPRILERLADDESGAVRQALVDGLHLLPQPVAAQHITTLRDDSDPQVRAAIFADVPRMLIAVAPYAYAAHIANVLERDEDEFVLRMALDAANSLAAYCRQQHEADLEPVIAQTSRAIAVFQARGLSPKLLRWADEASERVWLASDFEALEIAAHIRDVTHDQFEADIRPIKPLAPWLVGDREKVGRVMALLAQNDFGLSLKTGRKAQIQRGEWIKRRVWRLLFEGRNSATDKRQAFLHTTGRHYFGTMLAPSARMAELAPTKVPGEPLFESTEGGWRNYLPLIDEVLHALDIGKQIQIFTSAGITEIIPPNGLLKRLRAFWRISRGFAELASQRNREPADFLDALRALGVEVTFRGYDEAREPNPAVARFFGAGGAE
ncbi:MAG: hypothetical protein AAGL68_00320 [Pseudomonadota bacterium]